MNERQFRDRLIGALGDPPEAGAAVRRLEANLYRAADGRAHRSPERGHPRGTAVLAGALALLVVAGLLAVQAAQHYRLVTTPATSPAIVPSTAATPAQTCLSTAPAQMIVIDLSAQTLVAYDRGCPFLTTPVTTGRAGLATSRGSFRVYVKYPAHQLVSPWPKGDPNWYPTTTVHYFLGLNPADGFAIHSAEWEPPAEFGQGSENGSYPSHGDVNVPTGAAERLYNWVHIGTEVVVDQPFRSDHVPLGYQLASLKAIVREGADVNLGLAVQQHL
jgi:lipoprotein-anchoring transpeptidase ErfK/SrfK